MKYKSVTQNQSVVFKGGERSSSKKRIGQALGQMGFRYTGSRK